MVRFKASETHFVKMMDSMNDLRKENAFCDIILKIGRHDLAAHRCVLSAGSPYFKSLFLGHFSEASMKEIDLSEVTEDSEAMEMILKFIYSGEVEITTENLGVTVKLSSFFLLETLREFCVKFMKESLCLQNCLKYYLCSAEHGLSNIEASAGLMMKSRFHDFLIFEENTIDLSVDELLLIIEKGALKHCSKANVLQFLAKWIYRGNSAKHVSVATEVLSMLNQNGFYSQYIGDKDGQIYSLYERARVSLQDKNIQGRDQFLAQFQSVLETLISLNKRFPKKCQDQQLCADDHCNINVPDNCEHEMTVVTLSPKQCVIKNFKKQKAEGLIHPQEIDYDQPVFDLCAYLPRTRSWYYMGEIEELDTPDYLLDAAGYDSTFMIMDDNIVLMDNRGDNFDLCNLINFHWQSPEFEYHEQNSDNENDMVEHNFQANDCCFVDGINGKKYMIVRIIYFTNEFYDMATEMYFRGYILNVIGETWHWTCIFLTPKVQLHESENGGMPEMNAKVSKASNELLVTHSTLLGGWNIAFVVNLNSDKDCLIPVVLMSQYIENEDIFKGISILEGNDQFYIVSNGTQNGFGLVKVLYKYRYNSNILTEVSQSGKVVSKILKPRKESDNETEFPCLSEVSTTFENSLWYIEGNMDIVSTFTEVRLNENNELMSIQHPPPPFACITRAFAGNVKRHLLANLKQISTFLMLDGKSNRHI